MLLLIVALEVLFTDLRLYHVTDWSPWAVALPLLAGFPLWLAWTWLKIWAVSKEGT